MQSPDLRTALTKRLENASLAVVLGVGSDLKGDDAAGLLIAQRLKEKKNPLIEVILGGTAPENFTGEIKRLNPSHLIVIDCAEMGKNPGHIELIDKDRIGGYTFSTHSLPLKVMIDYLLNDIKPQVVVIGIEPKTLKFGAEPSSEVLDAVINITEAVNDSLKKIPDSSRMNEIRKNTRKDLLKATVLGVELASTVFFGAFAGYLLDKWANTGPAIMIVGLILGAAAGMWNTVRLGIKG